MPWWRHRHLAVTEVAVVQHWMIPEHFNCVGREFRQVLKRFDGSLAAKVELLLEVHQTFVFFGAVYAKQFLFCLAADHPPRAKILYRRF